MAKISLWILLLSTHPSLEQIWYGWSQWVICTMFGCVLCNGENSTLLTEWEKQHWLTHMAATKLSMSSQHRSWLYGDQGMPVSHLLPKLTYCDSQRLRLVKYQPVDTLLKADKKRLKLLEEEKKLNDELEAGVDSNHRTSQAGNELCCHF